VFHLHRVRRCPPTTILAAMDKKCWNSDLAREGTGLSNIQIGYSGQCSCHRRRDVSVLASFPSFITAAADIIVAVAGLVPTGLTPISLLPVYFTE